MNPATLVNLPDASTTLTQASAYSIPIFSALLPMATAIIGIIIGAILLRALIDAIIHAVWSFAAHGSPRARRFVENHPDLF